MPSSHLRFRRRRAEKSGQEIDSNEVHVPLDEFRMDSVESSGITTDLVYQNVSEIPSDRNGKLLH